jgi:hypothetical protein
MVSSLGFGTLANNAEVKNSSEKKATILSVDHLAFELNRYDM